VTLARKAIIHCGKAKLSWTKFAVAVELFVEVETATHRLSEVSQSKMEYLPFKRMADDKAGRS
jgi:predicted transcriptional regulator